MRHPHQIHHPETGRPFTPQAYAFAGPLGASRMHLCLGQPRYAQSLRLNAVPTAPQRNDGSERAIRIIPA